jgi:hypothetical protein
MRDRRARSGRGAYDLRDLSAVQFAGRQRHRERHRHALLAEAVAAGHTAWASNAVIDTA